MDEESVPVEILTIVNELGIHRPVDIEPGGPVDKLVALAENGYCMTCEGPLGRLTQIVVTTPDSSNENSTPQVVLAFCSGACSADMTVMGFLQEVHQDIKDQIDFRGGAGDRPTE
jgi:hypothetical protein